MEIRYDVSPQEFAGYKTQQLRDGFLISDLYQADKVRGIYSHVNRTVVLGIMPVNTEIVLDDSTEVWENFGTKTFFERREAGFFNIGGPGGCRVNGKEYPLERKDCIYVGKEAQDVTFYSNDAENPAKFYGVSAPAHHPYETRLVTMAQANKIETGSAENASQRQVYQFIHPDVMPSCQLSMGFTVLAPGNVWNTVPPHLHARRNEIYTYFDLPKDELVFHFLGAPEETRHLVVRNEEAVLHPSWSLHTGCATAAYIQLWATTGENLDSSDVDGVDIALLR
ncbi:5-dehydro-4-deoxy-D-glucuronate isomerase [Ruminococcaceae bacterium OttesenSCG-928-A16]|nr:5-dehydro-4-deoxy-D-glucuronate isomerase [Ruminococcaceae bacterium OttesenSCG-928-A16]